MMSILMLSTAFLLVLLNAFFVASDPVPAVVGMAIYTGHLAVTAPVTE